MNNSKQPFFYFLKKKKRKIKQSVLGLSQAFRLHSSTWVPLKWLASRVFANVMVKNEPLSLAQDREVLQTVLNRAVRQCECSRKALLLAIYLKNRIPKKERCLELHYGFYNRNITKFYVEPARKLNDTGVEREPHGKRSIISLEQLFIGRSLNMERRQNHLIWKHQ